MFQIYIHSSLDYFTYVRICHLFSTKSVPCTDRLSTTAIVYSVISLDEVCDRRHVSRLLFWIELKVIASSAVSIKRIDAHNSRCIELCWNSWFNLLHWFFYVLLLWRFKINITITLLRASTTILLLIEHFVKLLGLVWKSSLACSSFFGRPFVYAYKR